ncbi:MAG: hypothetical protein OXT69_13605 [Candidatus Poribacteria bacterium]|nr:hypothetical protein [Candidatus Poribacteria bacterium]
MRVLHLIRRRMDAYAESAMQAHEADGLQVFAAYLQDAVYGPFPRSENAAALKEDCQMRGVKPDLPTLSYAELAALIFEYDRVVAW